MKRREFITKSAMAGTVAGIGGLSFLTSCSGEVGVTPTEDLMREHGVLGRIMLIYDYCREKLENNDNLIMTSMVGAAVIVRDFIEAYHEKLEEEHLFPLFIKNHRQEELVNTLLEQHKTGRIITSEIIRLGQMTDGSASVQQLSGFLLSFNKMYRAHASREDTILFPDLKNIVSSREYESMGEEFENKEHELFGEKGFESMVVRVGEIEQSLGISDLKLYTPA